MFQAALRGDRTCLQLARALERYRRRDSAGREEAYMGDRGAERVDEEWENAEADRRRERYEKRKPGLTADLRGRLRAMATDELRAWVLAELAAMSTVPAGNAEPSRGGGGSSAPPRQQEVQADPRWGRYDQIERGGLLLKADLILEVQGHGTQAAADLSTRQLAGKVVTHGRGLSCKEAARLPELAVYRDVSPAFVRRVRQAQGTGLADLDVLGERVSPIDGLPVMDAEAAGVRRVRIES